MLPSRQGETNSLEWIQIYKFIEEGDFTNEYKSDVDDLVDIKKLGLHKIVSKPVVLPYYDMV
jgi:hypothetical protein